MNYKKILNYEILSKIGEGGMGNVYKGKHSTLDRYVAIKILLPELLLNPHIRERFINEAKTLSKLNHKNIVSLFDFTESDKDLFLIMEYVDGIPLNELIENNTEPISENRCLKIFREILEGFSYAHQNGIVHRDIKPSNIILQDNDIPKILDFGIAKILECDSKITKVGTKIGSVMYMSPEQILGSQVDYRSDIYSLGVTLFEMLSGKSPYDNDTESEFKIQSKIIQEPFPLIRSINPNISDFAENLIKKATSKDPLHRFQSCEEFIEALNSEKVIVPTTSKTVISSPVFSDYNSHPKQKKINTGVVVTILIALAILIMFGLYVYKNKESEIKITTNNKNDNPKNNIESVLKKSDESQIIETALKKWLSAIESKSSMLSEYYTHNIDYFNSGNVSIKNVINDKINFYRKWDKISFHIDNLNISKERDDKYICVFDKSFKADNPDGKYYEGKVKSRITFVKSNGEWLISGESDDNVYWTNKN